MSFIPQHEIIPTQFTFIALLLSHKAIFYGMSVVTVFASNYMLSLLGRMWRKRQHTISISFLTLSYS
jgi:hypothetical protein